MVQPKLRQRTYTSQDKSSHNRDSRKRPGQRSDKPVSRYGQKMPSHNMCETGIGNLQPRDMEFVCTECMVPAKKKGACTKCGGRMLTPACALQRLAYASRKSALPKNKIPGLPCLEEDYEYQSCKAEDSDYDTVRSEVDSVVSSILDAESVSSWIAVNLADDKSDASSESSWMMVGDNEE
eukprot:TRINITY_DN60576_c0_g1_i1.p1 TRINITY_DN60576_c0_g1~~TRINITY_DN60576_c0_g1_i1.p1  ORF type:complete len:180 (+),score=24.35 TRINITY_DN60576_c0_g1_i1:82-621(+)